jgi:hypothetical protein
MGAFLSTGKECRTSHLSVAPPGLGALWEPLPRVPSRFAGLHPGLFSRRAYGALSFAATGIFASKH